MNPAQGRKTSAMTDRTRRPRMAMTGAAAIWSALMLVGLGAATAQEAATGPASQPTTATATEPGATEPAATEPATGPATEPATGPATGPATVPSIIRPPATRPAIGNGPLMLNFKDASLRTVLDYLSEAAGFIIVGEPKIEGRITLQSRWPVPVEEAVGLLDTVLKEKGYAAIRMGRTLKIVSLADAKKELIQTRFGNNPDEIKPSDRIITQVIPIRYVDAVKLKSDLSSLIPSSADVTTNAVSNTLIVTATEATVRRILEIIKAIDSHQADISTVKVFQLKYANATSTARLIQDIFKEDQTQQAGGGGFGGGRGRGGGGFVFTMGGAPPAADEGKGGRNVKVIASADDRTNTLVVSASPDVMKVIEGIVKDLDNNPAEVQAVYVYRVRNGDASNMASVLNTTFGWGGTTPTGGTGARQTTGMGLGGPLGGSSGITGGRGSTIGGGGGGTRGLSSGGLGGISGGRGAGGLGAGGLGTGGFGTGRTGGTTGLTGGGRTAGGGPGARGPTGTGSAGADLLGQVYVVPDPDTNSLIITTASKNWERVKEIIMDLDRAVPQVLIKVLVAEVTHTNALDLGMEFAYMNLNASKQGTSVGTNFNVAAQTTGFTFKLNTDHVLAAIRALANVSKLDVLSRPYILTGDNQQAQIMVGQDVPFITSSQITDNGQVINTIQYSPIGIILQVTPHINPQGLVTLDVYPEISSQTGETVPLNQFASSPVFARRFAQSRVAIKDGQTIVIGGLMQDQITKSVDKVPVLGDIPLLGLLFQHTNEKKTKTELLIFLTPHVAQQPEELKGMSEDEISGLKIVPKAVEPGAFEDHMMGLQRGGVTSRPAPTTQESDFHAIEVPPATQPATGDQDSRDTRNP
ncbi:MAG: type II secretion system secretin GspD [Phycisphaerae bacterium]